MSTCGCPYEKFNFWKMFEECKLTGENVEGRVECDFGFEDCPNYVKAQCKADGEPDEGG